MALGIRHYVMKPLIIHDIARVLREALTLDD